MSGKETAFPKECTPMGCMPRFSFPEPEMQLFSPADVDVVEKTLLPLRTAVRTYPKTAFIPRKEDCFALWDEYAMFPNIREHSKQVAGFMMSLAHIANEKGWNVDVDAACAVGLLHDLSKSYCIKYGGSHAQLGAAWTKRETGNAAIARAVLLHVHFPWEDKLEEALHDRNFFLPLAVIYADKRVKHNTYASIDERFADLRERYGVNDYVLERIEVSRQQGLVIERSFSQQLGVDFHAYTPDYRWLVG